MLSLIKNRINSKKSIEKPVIDGELNRLHRLLKKEIKEKFSSRLKLYIIDTGSCGACEIELQALFNPLYDVSKLGIEVVYKVKEADIMIITGLLTENMYPVCLEAYKGLKEPKQVISIGDCPLFHAPFKDTFAIKGQGIVHFPTGYHISGCPPNPRTLLRGLLKFLESV
jgi:Ni,Fe-hydrogenase III small subunit